jgi:arsenate reductase (glutaredoxin)
MAVIIWHNPRCSKSRAALQLLEARGATPKIVLYLEAPPSAAQLKRVLKALKKTPRELMRTCENAYRALKLADPNLDEAALIAAMVAHPILIERPVVLNGAKAALGRPPEAVLEIL